MSEVEEAEMNRTVSNLIHPVWWGSRFCRKRLADGHRRANAKKITKRRRFCWFPFGIGSSTGHVKKDLVATAAGGTKLVSANSGG